MRLLIVFVTLLLAACNYAEQVPEAYASTPRTRVYESSFPKAFSKPGNILDVELHNYGSNNKIIMWNNYMGLKDSIYSFATGERVVVYAKTGEYYFLSPAKDTSITGFILAGWVEFDHNNKDANRLAIASLPTLKADGSFQHNAPESVKPINLTKLAAKMKNRDTLIFDDKHLLEDNFTLLEGKDTLPIIFEKQEERK